jgi:carbonic anhydrase
MPKQIADAVDGIAQPPANNEEAETAYQRLFRLNRQWVEEITERDPTFFSSRATEQHPTFLFLGCSDSRVPAELLTGAQPGEMFVHRNIANMAEPTDINMLSVLHYAVDVLQVKTIMVCGHYGCGGVRAAMDPEPHGFVDHWLRGIRDVMERNAEELGTLEPGPGGPRERRLVELNAAAQARALRRTPVVQNAWRRGQPLAIHAAAYDLADGILHDLAASAVGTEDGRPIEVPDAHLSPEVAEHERRRLERRATAVVDAEAATEAAVPAPGVEATGVADH